MSTRIERGYRVQTRDIFAFCHRVRAALNPVRDDLDARWLMRHAVAAIDLSDRDGTPREPLPLLDAMHAFDDAQDRENAKGYRQASLSYAFDPHQFEVAFALDSPEATGEVTGTGALLARVYTSESALLQAWEALDEVEAWPYWDHSDRPGALTETEWCERRDAYARTTSPGAPATETCLTFALRSSVHDTGMLSMVMRDPDPAREDARRKRLMRAAPSFVDRVQTRALDLCVHEHLRQDDQDATTATARDLIGAVRLYREHLTSQSPQRHRPERIALRTALLDAVRATLDPDAAQWAIATTCQDRPATPGAQSGPQAPPHTDPTRAREAARAFVTAHPEPDHDGADR